MEAFDVYQFILCLIVFIMLTGLFTILVIWIVKLLLRGIRAGLDDEKIKTEYLKHKDKKPSKLAKVLDKVVLGLCCAVLFCMFLSSFAVSVTTERCVSGPIPAMNVVRSGSMSYIHKNHKFLQQGEVTDQLQKFDVVFISAPPKEEDLKVNDIVVYEINGDLIIHRIVKIEEPNEKHPNERYFLLQGDANELADSFPVLYKQIRGIYTGHRIPFVGSFVLFMQSPAGWLCILLVVFALIATPIAEKKLEKARYLRLLAMGLIEGENTQQEATAGEDEALLDVLEDEGADDAPEEETEDGVDEESAATVTEVDPFGAFGRSRSFAQKLEALPDEGKAIYSEIIATVRRIEGVRVNRSFKCETCKSGKVRVCKLTIRGKTVNVYLALPPENYVDGQYACEDVSAKKSYAGYALRVKASSRRQVDWIKTLIVQIAKNHKLKLAKDFSSFKRAKPFAYKLKVADAELKTWYKSISTYLKRTKKATATRTKKHETYKVGSTRICRLTIRGKSIVAYFALSPKAYEGTKHSFRDVSAVKANASYPLCVKINSVRQFAWMKTLVEDALREKGGDV